MRQLNKNSTNEYGTSDLSAEYSDFEGISELSLDEIKQVSGGIVLLTVGAASAGYAAFAGGATLGFGLGALGANMDWGTNKDRRQRRRERRRKRRSDIRLKQAIQVVGHIKSLGLNMYSWEYKDAPGERFVGVMAQDLLARDDLRSAVFTFADGPFAGYYGVDYDKLGINCLPVEAWDGKIESLLVGKPDLVHTL